MRLRLDILSCLVFAVSLDAAAADLYATVNRLRAGGGNCAAMENLPPLRPQAALERVARDLSRGGDLKQSEKDNGYRAMRSRALSITGAGIDARAEGILSQPGYCAQLQEAGMAEVGIYQDSRQVWIVTAAVFTPSLAMSAQAAGQRVLELVNRARATPRNCGNQAFTAARPLRWNDALAAASRLHAEDMARYNYFSHSGRDGSDPAQRIERAGYRYHTAAENIAAGTQMQADDAVAGWIKSPGHCANLMNPAFAEMGVAFAANASSEFGIYWAQAFGTPR